MSDENKCCGKHDHNHDHNGECCESHEHDHEILEVPTIVLTLEDDSELECYVLDVFAVEDKEYVALLPIGEEEVYLYRYTKLDEEEVALDVIEDDEEYEKVAEAFDQLCEDEG